MSDQPQYPPPDPYQQGQPQPGQYPQGQPPPGQYPPGQYPPPQYAPYQFGTGTLPGPVKALRICLWVFGGLWLAIGVLSFIGYFSVADDEDSVGYFFGYLLVQMLPAILAIIAAPRIASGRRSGLILSRVSASLFILIGLGAIGNGVPGGLIVVIAGIVLLALTLQRATKEFFALAKQQRSTLGG